MEVARPRVLVTETLGDKALTLLKEGGVQLEAHDLLDPDAFTDRLKHCDAVIIRSAHKMLASHMDAAPNVRIVARAGTGVDNIDVAAATERGILVLNTSGANAQAAAEHTMGLLVGLLRHIRRSDQHVRSGQWDRAAFFGEELHGKILGIIGIGRVGGRVARMAGVFGMKVYAYDPYVPDAVIRERGAEPVEKLDDLLMKAEVLTIHTPKSGPRLSMKEFRLLPKGAYVLNVARGGLYDEAALTTLLEEGHLSGVALDVFEKEPPAKDHPILQRDDVLFTCHLGGSTRQAQDKIGMRIARAVLKALEGALPDEAVNVPFPAVSPEESELLIAAGDTLGRLLSAEGPGRGNITLAMNRGQTKEAAELVGRALLCGYLSSAGEESVNMINALKRGAARGINVSLQSAMNGGPEEGTFTAWLSYDRGSLTSIDATSGTLRLKSWSGVSFDLALGRQVLFTRHKDVPGVVGKVGVMLEKAQLNIATLELSRDAQGGHAMMVLTLDGEPPEDLMEMLRSQPGMERVGAIHLPLIGVREPAAQVN